MTKSKKGFMKLNDDELNWLENKLGVIDVQKGCPVQCIVCGAEAQKYSGSMPWKDFMVITDSILDVKIRHGYNVLNLNPKSLLPFYSSDPIYYRSMDGKKERTIYDVFKEIVLGLNKFTTLTTAGWRQGDNYMQRAMDGLAADKSVKHSTVSYSIKTVSKNVINEYAEFIEKYDSNPRVRGRITNISSHTIDSPFFINDAPATPKRMQKAISEHWFSKADKAFIEDSNYTKQVIANMKTLKSFNNMPTYFIQHIDLNNETTNSFFNGKYAPYFKLFSEYFVDKMFTYCKDRASISYAQTQKRAFKGMGHAIDAGIPVSSDYEKVKQSINANSANMANYMGYSTAVNKDGVLQIYYGTYNDLLKILVPKEHFMILAQQNKKDKASYKMYNMLAGLQGKNLLE